MKTIIAILCLLLCAPTIKAAEQPRQDGIGFGVAAVVVCVGGYCIYKMVKLCQKKFPKEKPKETNSVFAASTDEYGASWNYASMGSCGPDEGDTLQTYPIDETNDVYIATLKITVGEWGEVTSAISAAKATDKNQWQSWEEFQLEVLSHGLVVTGMADGSKHYSRNRVPCGPELVPIQFDETTKAIVHTGGTTGSMITISIERSIDFQNWSHFMTVNQPFDSGFQVQDLTRFGQMFYRVKVQ